MIMNCHFTIEDVRRAENINGPSVQALKGNSMSLKNVKEKFRVTYDSGRDGNFTVHNPNRVNIKFGMHCNRLHYHDTGNRQVNMVQTVTENEKGYSKRQLTDARTARDLYAKV